MAELSGKCGGNRINVRSAAKLFVTFLQSMVYILSSNLLFYYRTAETRSKLQEDEKSGCTGWSRQVHQDVIAVRTNNCAETNPFQDVRSNKRVVMRVREASVKKGNESDNWGSRVSNILSNPRVLWQRLMSDPQHAIPTVLFTLMLATIVFIGEPPYALAKEPKAEKTAKADTYCLQELCMHKKNRG